MHICRKHFVTNFQGIIFWLPVDIVLHDPYCHISKHSQQLGGLSLASGFVHSIKINH